MPELTSIHQKGLSYNSIKKIGSFPVPPFQIQFRKVYLTLSLCNEIWRGEQIDNSEQICSSYFAALHHAFSRNNA